MYTRKAKKGGAHHKPKSAKKHMSLSRSLGMMSIGRAPLKSLKKPKININAMFLKEMEAPEEEMFDPEFADNVISKFKDFLDDLEEKEEEALEENDGNARSNIEIMKISIALRLIDAFGTKAKVAAKNNTKNAFNDDLSSLLNKMAL